MGEHTRWTPEMEALLGTRPDTEVTKQLGLQHPCRARLQRRKLGIPRFRVQFQEIPQRVPPAVRRASAAYLLGAFLSDGHLSWPGRDPHPIWGVRDEFFADCISIALSNLGCSHDFRKVPRREPYHKDTWTVREKAAGRFGGWLLKVAPNKERLPKISDVLIRPFVAGLMDGDGSVRAWTPGSPTKLSYSGGDGFVLDFRKLLELQGIRQGKLRVMDGPGFNRPCYVWTINIEDFLAAGLNFAMPRKQVRLTKWCCKVRQPARKVRVARWWMKEVYVRDWATSVPMGEVTFP